MPTCIGARPGAFPAYPRHTSHHGAWQASTSPPAAAACTTRSATRVRSQEIPSEGPSEKAPASLSSLVEDLKDTSQLGKRGELWVVAQFAVLLPIAFPPAPLQGVVTAVGVAAILGGLALVGAGLQSLKGNLTPLPKPREGGSLVTNGVYGYVRHPMYGGLVLGSLGLAVATSDDVRLLLAGLLFWVLDQKASYEESLLVEKYGEQYTLYKTKTKKIVPYLY